MSIKPDMIFWGGTGQAKVLREIIEQNYNLCAIFDNDPTVQSPFPDVPIFYGWQGLQKWEGTRPHNPCFFIVTIGGDRGQARVEIHKQLEQTGLHATTAVHPSAFIAANAKIGPGCQILAQAAVCVEAELGAGCIVNTCASVDHECQLGQGVHIAPGAHLAGQIKVGDFTMIGTGATVLPRLSIGRNCVIGAGAVVTHSLGDGVIAYGNPARIARHVNT